MPAAFAITYRAMWCASLVFASVLPVLSGIGTSQHGPVISAAISRAAASKSAVGLAADFIEYARRRVSVSSIESEPLRGVGYFRAARMFIMRSAEFVWAKGTTAGWQSVLPHYPGEPGGGCPLARAAMSRNNQERVSWCDWGCP